MDLVNNRDSVPVLLIARDIDTQSKVKQGLQELGFARISSTNSHAHAIDRMRSQLFPLVLFDADPTTMSSRDFVLAAKNLDPSAFLIAVASELSIDEVFELLKVGARGFVLTPFTISGLEDILLRTIEGPPLSTAILEADDREAAFVGLILSSFYKLTATKRHARSHGDNRHEVQKYLNELAEATRLAKTFSKKGTDVLREKIMNACIKKAEIAASRLGRLRARLNRERNKTT